MNATDQNTPPVTPLESWAELIALEAPIDAPAPAGTPWRARLLRLAVFLSPLLMALIWIALAPAAYVSEARFVLRHKAEAAALPGGGDALSGMPSENGSPDGYALRDFLLSRDAMAQAGGDFKGAGADARYADFRRRVSVDYETSSGVIGLRASATSPAAAQALTEGLLRAAGLMVDRFDQASDDSEYLAMLASPSLPDAPAHPDQTAILLGAAALGLAGAWSLRR